MKQLHTWIAGCKTRWQALQAREQQFIRIGAITLAVLVTYFLVIDPCLTSRRQLSRELPALHDRLSQMKALADDARRFASLSGHTTDAVTVIAALRKELPQITSSSATAKFQTDPQGNIRLAIDNADFNTLLPWLGKIQAHHRLRVAKAVMERTETPGMVKADISLELVGNASVRQP